MHRIHRWSLTLAAAWALAACGGPDARDDAGAEGQTPGAEESPMPGMPGMQDMAGGGMMEQMQAHMQMMQGMSGDSMMAMMPEHRQSVANMISQMNREMQDMNMPGDTAWNAAVDSLRDDLTRMPAMSPEQLDQFMPGHRQRVMRLLEMHDEMMQSMHR